MNEFTICLMLMVGPLSEAPTGMGEFTLTISEAEQVRIVQGTIEYDKRMQDAVLCRLEIASEVQISNDGTVKREKRETLIVGRLAAKDCPFSWRNFPRECDSDGLFNHGPMIFAAAKSLGLKPLEDHKPCRVGRLENMSQIMVENAKGTDRVTCLVAQTASPPPPAWISNSNVVSIVYKWQDKVPDAARLRCQRSRAL